MALTPLPCDCGGGGAAAAPAAVSTGTRRVTNSVAPLNLVTLRPGLQSATLTVIAGDVTATTADGASVVPEGATVTWSTNDDDDTSLSALTFTGAPVSDYIVAFTYKPTVGG